MRVASATSRSALALLAFATACSANIEVPPGQDGGRPPPADAGPPPAALTGRELFASSCALCHGSEGEGSVRAYELRHPVVGFTTFVVRTGRPGLEFPGVMMAAHPVELVSDAQLGEIWTWLDSFPQPTTGEGLYLDYCRNCHGTDATNGASGPEIDEESAADMIEQVREGSGDTNYALRDMYMPSFDSSVLSDAEITAIADYVRSLP